MIQAFSVLLCCEHYPPSVGGVQEVIRQIAERLAASGLQVTVATSTHAGRAADTVRNGVRVVSFPIKGNRTRGMTGPLEQYQSFLDKGCFDAILIKAAQQWTFDAAVDVLPRLSGRKLFIPCGFSGLNDPRYRTYYQDMPAWLNLFDGLIFYANDYQDIAFARQHGLTHIHCLPNGVDEREFADIDSHDIRKKLGIDDNQDVLMSVGSLIAAKGHWEVLRAFGQARLLRSTTLVINGNVPGKSLGTVLKRTLKHALSGRWPLTWEARWLEARHKAKRVIITDLARADLVNLYKTADLFVFASHVEYSPLVLFEAAAAGTAFLSSPVGNSQEIADWTQAGKITENTPTGNQRKFLNELLLNISEMLNDKIAMKSVGQRGIKNIATKKLTWNEISKQYNALLLEIPIKVNISET